MFSCDNVRVRRLPPPQRESRPKQGGTSMPAFRRLRRLLAFLLLFLLTSGNANAGPLEDGVAAANRGDYSTALRLLRPLAEHGDAQAQYNLGVVYAHGRGVAKDDSTAVLWYRKAAEQGFALAQSNLGLMYANGRGVARDDATAVLWYRKATEQGLALPRSEEHTSELQSP